MNIRFSGRQLYISYAAWINDTWTEIPPEAVTASGMDFLYQGGHWSAQFHEDNGCLSGMLAVDAPFPTKLRLTLSRPDASHPWHLIPCNIYGDNNAAFARPGEFPLLTESHPGTRYCSPVWEFRADRAAMPVSALSEDGNVWAVSIDPYAETDEGFIRCGVFAELPASFGVTLGYTNRPVTFLNRSVDSPPTGDAACRAHAACRIYCLTGERTRLHEVIRREYAHRHERASFRRSVREAADGVFDALVRCNWDSSAGEYTNRKCCPPGDQELKPWRNVTEIGWTGGGILALPMLMYSVLCPDFSADRWGDARDAYAFFNRICACWSPASGMLYDLMAPNAEGSRLNGWWTYYGLVHDCHCAYNSGTAVHSLLQAVLFLRRHGKEAPPIWLETAQRVMETAVALQRDDGAFGYTYSPDRPAVLDWEGFAGCWFVPCAVLLHRLTHEKKWLTASERGARFYAASVRRLSCSGSPMDTWKAVDEEGNLAFIRSCRLLHEETGSPEWLELLRLGAEYEYLWRYGFRTRQELAPLCSGWCACGGSVTSVSNPHIHPMGVLADGDLRYLASVTGDSYHLSRAQDSTAWLIQTLELYPEKTGYGRYGVLSERWCPSDGLLTERNSDGLPYASWYSYNLWAAADALQALCELMEEEAAKNFS